MIKYIYRVTFLVTILLFVLSSVLTAQENDDPVENFEHLWNTFDRNYAIFGPKHVDWDLLYEIYRPKITPGMPEDDLFSVMCSMLGHLNDNHVRLRSSSPERSFSAGFLNQLQRPDFSQLPVPENYFRSPVKKLSDGVFSYGWIADNIGYFHFGRFSNREASAAAIDEIVESFKDADGMIIDVRRNGGGDDFVGKIIADRFADRQRLYMKTMISNGPGHDDFTPPRYWYVEPNGPRQFTKAVVLLTNRFSISAAENFALAMRVLPHVTVVGDFTSGCFADVYSDNLPNGWRFGCSYKLFVDTNDFCWEGIGVPPDLRITNTDNYIEEGKDRVLDFAIDLINKGNIPIQDESGSLNDVRESLAWSLEKNILSNGIAPALEAFHTAKRGNPDNYYIESEELDIVAGRLSDVGREEEALRVLLLNTEEFPGYWWVHHDLAEAYENREDHEKARASFEKSMNLNPRNYPREREAFDKAAEYIKNH
ncbi:S41 family peptidase [candidate division KSB1 bacterium]